MVRFYRMIPVIMMITCVVCLAGCNDEDQLDEAQDKLSLTRMEAEIDDLIDDADCKDAGECRTIAFGAKPCGGPWSYKIFSVTELDTLKLAGLVDAYNKFNQVLNERYGWTSDCMVVSAPNIDCVEGRCVAVE